MQAMGWVYCFACSSPSSQEQTDLLNSERLVLIFIESGGRWLPPSVRGGREEGGNTMPPILSGGSDYSMLRGRRRQKDNRLQEVDEDGYMIPPKESGSRWQYDAAYSKLRKAVVIDAAYSEWTKRQY
ncbi:hypothetical protein H6P81_009476 [Aristolochia fimbriata]|uniref:Uncharacterized protein n=1 Tax=Aristolochia fimbriata TaxID=158543 RepID=A0AAV7EM42_ARIFI|nr:hypothetical protein H6P81_009476 [Aristolochia fimbriata]